MEFIQNKRREHVLESEVGSSLAETLLVEHANIYELDSLKQVINVQ